ncbi:MAG: hypothetical protein AB1646_20555 [Thermodesulfobacteriota bacterium]
MNRIVILGVSMMLATAAHADSVKTLAGLWVAAKDASVYTLRLEVPRPDPVTMIEELSGSLSVRSAGPSNPSTALIPVTGQYLARTGIVVLNIGEPAAGREYGIGDTRDSSRRGFLLRIFRVRPAHGVIFERELFFEYKRTPPATSGNNPKGERTTAD